MFGSVPSPKCVKMLSAEPSTGGEHAREERARARVAPHDVEAAVHAPEEAHRGVLAAQPFVHERGVDGLARGGPPAHALGVAGDGRGGVRRAAAHDERALSERIAESALRG